MHLDLVQYLYPMISEEISLWFFFIKNTHSYHIELQVVKKLSLSLLICWNVLIMFCRSRMILLTVHWMSSINPVIRARCEQNCFQTICCHQHISCLFQNILNVLHILSVSISSASGCRGDEVKG